MPVRYPHDFVVAHYSGDRKTGRIALIFGGPGGTRVETLPLGAPSGKGPMRQPILVGVTRDKQAVLLEPETKKINLAATFPPDTFPAHVYSDPASGADWFMNDGEKETGNDTLNCGDRGSSVSVVVEANSANARYLTTICVGRGHHQAAFTAPTDQAPGLPKRACISNLNDGTVDLIGNDAADAATYQKVVATVNLCERDKEDAALSAAGIPNKAYPHGLAFSRVTGKLYNLNNGYGTVAVIDPVSGQIEQRIGLKGHSNMFAAPDGRYFIARGADRKTDPAHVLAKVSVFDPVAGKITDQVTLPDIYIGKYFFNPQGTRLYLTGAVSGSPEQQVHLKADAVLAFDLTALPKLKLVAELRFKSPVGFLSFVPGASAAHGYMLASISEAGTVDIIDESTLAPVETVTVNQGAVHSRIWTV